ncbi:unnamed protein product [Penicillium egyptiacum]|uniref:DUF7587 domain-containing protein n=1 Tax=Penicillium egyptiacum TaxID=1303716 RepID=A0A9W4KBH1_9EURO|nr:unnamed protein product [Penicillium egyptiacum]
MCWKPQGAILRLSTHLTVMRLKDWSSSNIFNVCLFLRGSAFLYLLLSTRCHSLFITMPNRDRPDTDSLAEAMGRTSLGDITEPEQLLFNPSPRGGADQCLKDIPRYLFRVVAPKSDGDTNGTWAHSKSAHEKNITSTQDVFSFLGGTNQHTKAFELTVHLQWYGHRYTVEDNFVSWTSSLLFAIQFIYYRRFSEDDKPSWNDIKLYVIDTTCFPTGTFMRDLDLIQSFSGVDNHKSDKNNSPKYWNLRSLYSLRTDKGYYFGEYLSQGSLKIENRSQMIPANILFENDRLRRLQPKFAGLYSARGDPDPRLADAVINLRKEIWSETTPLLSPSELHNRLQAVKEIVDNVAPGWRFPLGIYLAALIGPASEIERQPFPNYNTLFEYFRSGILDDQEHSGLEPSLFNVTSRGSPEMSEQKHVQALVRGTYRHFKLTQALVYLDKIKRNIRSLNENNLFREHEVAAAAEITECLARAGQVFSSPSKV